MTQSDLSVLKWHSRIEKQNHRKWYAYGRVEPLIVALNQVPPFWHPRTPKTGSAISLFQLVSMDTGAVTTITAKMVTAGLEVRTYAAKAYDLIVYPSGVGLSGTNFKEGWYYAKMTDADGVTLYSDVFAMKQNLFDLIKVEWCHGEDLGYNNGHIDYSQGYKNYMYLCSEIGKPTYPYTERVENRDGYNFFQQQISYKLHRFQATTAEHVLDVLRTVRVHDFVTIIHRGETFSVDEFLMSDPTWHPSGWLGSVDIEFKTDTVIITTGKARSETECLPAAGSCLVTDYIAVGLVDDASEEYNNYYTTDRNGERVNVDPSKYVLTRYADGQIRLLQRRSNGINYDLVSAAEVLNTVVFDNGNNQYYFYSDDLSTFTLPSISSVTHFPSNDFNLRFRSYQGATNTVCFLMEDGTEIQGANFPTSSADEETLIYLQRYNGIAVKLKAGSAACGNFYETDWYYFEGVDFWIIEADFEVQ